MPGGVLFLSLWKPIVPHKFKNVLFELFNLQLCFFFFSLNDEICKDICSAWISCTSKFFSHRLMSYDLQKYNRNIFGLLKCTSMDFFQTDLWKGVLKISKKSTKNTLARVSFLTKFQTSGLQFYLKRNCGKDVFLWILHIF